MRRTISFGALVVLVALAVLLAAACSVPVDIDWGSATTATTTTTGTETPTPLPGSTIVRGVEASECLSVTSATSVSATILGMVPADWTAPMDVFFHQTQSNQCSNTGTAGCSGAGLVVDSLETASADMPDPLVAGLGEIARVSEITGSAFVLSLPLENTYTSGGAARAQLCRVFSFDTMTVTSAGRLEAMPWDGSRGGIVAVKVGTLDLQGEIDASEAGFRGGTDGVPGAVPEDTATTACNEAGGRGEGWAGPSPACGRQYYASGGGGGNPSIAGGAGGGNAGAGGSGGRVGSSIDVQGFGGAGVYAGGGPLMQLGGGGGAGNSGASASGPGGRGGGLVVVIADDITGDGTIRADGGEGGCSVFPQCMGMVANAGGASGGGAGGTISIATPASLGSLVFSAEGGDGGDVYGMMAAEGAGGPGGGGGAGRILGVVSMPGGGAAGTILFPTMVPDLLAEPGFSGP